MKIDKRPFYIWVVVLLANIGSVLCSITLFMDGTYFKLSYLLDSWIYIALGISLFLTIVPVLFSKSNSKWKNHFGYGIPVLLLLTLPYFVHDYYTCTGKMCGLYPFIFAWAFGLSAIIFALFYTMGVHARKWNVKFVLTLIWIEVILLVGSALYFSLPAFN